MPTFSSNHLWEDGAALTSAASQLFSIPGVFSSWCETRSVFLFFQQGML